MIGQSLWKNLKVLVSFDKQIEDIKKEVKQTEKLLKKDQDTIPSLEALIEEYKQNYQKARKNVDLQELNSNELKEKEENHKTRLDEIENPKEYKAAEKELKTIIHKRIEQEDSLIKAWHQLESSKKTYEEIKEEKEKEIEQLKEGVESQQNALKDLKAQFEKLVSERENTTKIIPAEWLEKYERMRHKVVDPIVPVVGTSCSACYYAVLRQDLAKLKKSGVLPCRNCYRFLYYDIEEEKDAKQESF